MCEILPSSTANQGDNTVLVAQSGAATPGATKQLLPPDRVLKELYIYAISIKSRDYIGRSSSFLVWLKKTRLLSTVDVIARLQ